MIDTSEAAFDLVADCARRLENKEVSYEWAEIYAEGWDSPVDFLNIIVPPLLFEGPGKSASMAEAFESLIHTCLHELAISLRNGYQAAKNDWEAMQANLIGVLGEDNLQQEALHMFLHHIVTVDLPINQELMETLQQWQAHSFESEPLPDAMTPEALQAGLSEVLEKQDIQNEYEFFEFFGSQVVLLPEDIRIGMLGFFLTHTKMVIREATVLFLLHQDTRIRICVLALLEQEQSQKQISPVGLRRLITMRNWLPNTEQKRLDKIIKSLRRSGLVCAPAEAPKDRALFKTYVSSIDGAGAQTAVSMFKVGRQYDMAGGVFKDQWGIVDTWVAPLSSKSKCMSVITELSDKVCSIEVDPSYIEQFFPYFLQLNVKSGKAVTPDILQWMEMLGLTCWQPQNLQIEALLATLTDTLEEELTPAVIQQSLKRSGQWMAKKKFALCWFEHDDECDTVLTRAPRKLFSYKKRNELIAYIGEKILEPRREKWLWRFVRLALWAKASVKRHEAQWQDFVVLALQLREGRAMNDIPLMKAIAKETCIDALDYD